MRFAHAFCTKTFGTVDYEHPMGAIDYGMYNIIGQAKFGAEFDNQRLGLIAELSDYFSIESRTVEEKKNQDVGKTK